MSVSVIRLPSTYPINHRLGSPQYGNKTSSCSRHGASDLPPDRHPKRPISLPGIDSLFSPLCSTTTYDGASSPDGPGCRWNPTSVPGSGSHSDPATPTLRSPLDENCSELSPGLLPPIRNLDLSPRPVATRLIAPRTTPLGFVPYSAGVSSQSELSIQWHKSHIDKHPHRPLRPPSPLTIAEPYPRAAQSSMQESYIPGTPSELSP
jgi:hypothetical protein